jgi:glucose-6-phosphate isomerase
MWFYIGNGRGEKDMVLLPYKDRLELFSRYLQQLIMESLGKGRDLAGNSVTQGIAVFGNKGSTDQHAYIQQLRDGINNFFVTFIEVLRDRDGESVWVEPGITSGDYLTSFCAGTRDALSQNGRESISIIIDTVSPFAVGVLIALFERAVGLYASLINVNAYHQPGVEAGKVVAAALVDLQRGIVSHVRDHKGKEFTAAELAAAVGRPSEVEKVFRICEHLVRNRPNFARCSKDDSPATVRYAMS